MPAKNRHVKGKVATKNKVPSQTKKPRAGADRVVTTQPLTSYDIFKLCIERAENLVKLHKAAHGKAGKPEKYTADAHRASIVLSISALDAFIRDFVICRTRELLAMKSHALPTALSVQIKRFIKDDELLEAARKDDLLERVEKAFRNDFEKRSFQGTKNIEEMLQVVGYKNVFHEVAMKAKMNEDTLRHDLDKFTQRRHAIAHRGDYELSQNPPKENVVTKKDAEDCIKLVRRIAKHMQKQGAS
ncbi:MAG: HEPN domain-containing protein [Thermodesulfobacteriota bacterium]